MVSAFAATYAHCVKFTKGQLDKAPFSQYVFKDVQAQMYRVKAHPLLGDEDSFECEAEGVRGYGDTKDDALHDLLYLLMDRSRKAAVA